MARSVSLLSCIALLSFSLGATRGSWHSHHTITGKGTVTYRPTNGHGGRWCNGSEQFTSQFTIEWLTYPFTVADIGGVNARITYQLKLADQTYNIADIELRDRRVIYKGQDSRDNSTFMFKVFSKNTVDDTFTQEIGTATAYDSFYNFGLWINLTSSDGQIANFRFLGDSIGHPTKNGGGWGGSLLGDVKGSDYCSMTWEDEVVSTE